MKGDDDMAKIKIKDNSAMVVFEIPPVRTLTDRQVNRKVNRLKELEPRIAELKALEAEKKKIESELIEALGLADESGSVETNKYIIVNTVFCQKRLDTTRLKKEHPEIAEAYLKDVKNHRFKWSEVS